MLGATALLFHDQAESLAALAAQQPPVSAAAMDYSLWLTRRPPADLPHDRAAFLWWTGVDYRFRRCLHAWLSLYLHYASIMKRTQNAATLAAGNTTRSGCCGGCQPTCRMTPWHYRNRRSPRQVL